jgi:hypothetical protein
MRWSGNSTTERVPQMVVQRNGAPPASPGVLSNLGYLGQSAPRSQSETPRQESFGTRKDAPTKALPRDREGLGPGQVAPHVSEDQDTRPAFTRLTLYEPDGSAIAFEGDGQIFHIERGRRAYLKTLDEAGMESIRKALTAAGTTRWQGGGSGARLVLEAQGMTRVAGLASGDQGIQALAALLRSLAK